MSGLDEFSTIDSIIVYSSWFVFFFGICMCVGGVRREGVEWCIMVFSRYVKYVTFIVTLY